MSSADEPEAEEPASGETSGPPPGPVVPMQAPPVKTRPPPCPQAARVLATGLAKALAELEEALSPGFDGKGGWIRGARIAGRRLRILLLPLLAPADPHGVKAARKQLGQVLDDLSASRDDQVVRKWLRRDGVEWSEAEAALVERMLAEGSDPPAAASELQGQTREGLARVIDAIREILRAHLPEDLRRPLPEGFPGVFPEPEADRLPPPKALRRRDPSPAEGRAARAFCEAVLATPFAEMDRVHDHDGDPEDLHDLRRDLRKFRYLLEALRSSYPDLGPLRDPLKHLVWLLGQVNDRRLVLSLLEQRPDDPAEVEGLRALEGRLEEEIRDIQVEAEGLADGEVSVEALRAALDVLTTF